MESYYQMKDCPTIWKKTKTFQYFSLQGAETEFSSPLFHTYAVEGENYISAPCAYKIEHE